MKRVLVLCVAALVNLLLPSARAEGLDLSVLTYNIRYDNPDDGPDRWMLRRDEVARLIRDHAPDVVGIQEALRNQLEDLSASLPGYGQLGVGRDDGKEKGEYAAILYRKERFTVSESGTFWLSDTPEVAGSRSWGNTCVRICTWAKLQESASGRVFRVYNVHLDHESEVSRLKSVELLRRRIGARGDSEPFLVTGDFNAGEKSEPIRAMKAGSTKPAGGTGLVDSFRAAHPSDTPAGTFNDFGRGHGGSEKIDYIFVPPAAAVADAGIDRRQKDGRFPSDHYAVWAKVRLPDRVDPENH